MSNCCDRFVMIEGEEDSFETWQGLRGPHYTPSVSEDGTLSWTNNGDLQNPADVNIKGPPGPGGVPGGTTGQLLAKASDEDYDTEWIDQPEMDAGHVSYDPTETYDDGTVGKELGTINSALTSLSSVTEIIDTASGAIASFPDGAGLPMRSLLAQINPVQDLHGYDNPWPAGGWKNKFLADFENQTVNGTTYTLQSDGKITTSGVPSSPTDLVVGHVFLPAGTYILNGCPANGGSGKYRLQVTDYPVVNNLGQDAGEGVEFTISTGMEVAVRTQMYTGAPSSLTFAPMIRLATETDATFAPYANICPISGWTGLSGQRAGKNLFDKDSAITGLWYSSGVFMPQQTGFLTIYCKVKPNTTYTLSGCSSWDNIRICYFNTENPTTFTRRQTPQGSPITFTTDSDTVLVSFGPSRESYGDGSGVQLELGSTASTYEEYDGEAISVSWQDEAGTVYGGTVDVVSGVLTADMGIKTELWKNFTSETATGSTLIRRQVSIASAQGSFANKERTISNVAPFDATIARETVHVSMASSGNYLYAILPPTTDPDLEITFCYPLATPQTYQLTPQQISTLLGNNTVFVDTGSVSVTYQASIKGYIDKVLAS